MSIKRILAPTDFSDASYEGLKHASSLAGHFDAEVLLCYVIPAVPTLPPDMTYTFEVPEYQRSLEESAESKLAELGEEYMGEKISWRQLTRHGDPAGEIVRLASEEAVDWIVISTHGLTGWRHLFFGSVAEKVVRLAPCPVLTVRAPTEESEGEASS